MKRIEDASEEMKDIFEQVWKIITTGRSQHLGDREIAEHFFMTGVSSARVLHGLMLNKKTKRTIAEYHFSPQGMILAKSSDGKLFMIQGFDSSGSPRWLPYPDLPQD